MSRNSPAQRTKSIESAFTSSTLGGPLSFSASSAARRLSLSQISRYAGAGLLSNSASPLHVIGQESAWLASQYTAVRSERQLFSSGDKMNVPV